MPIMSRPRRTTEQVRTTGLRQNDVLREIVKDADRPWGLTREVVLTDYPRPTWISYDSVLVAAWVITGTSATDDGEKYIVKRVATSRQMWDVVRPS